MPHSRTDTPAAPASHVATVERASVPTFVVLVGAHFIVDCVGQMWTIFKKLENLDVARAGMIFTAGVMLAQLLQPFFGHLADSGRRRAVVLAGLGLAPITILVGIFGRHPTLMESGVGYAAMFAIILASKLGSAMFHPGGASAAGEGDPSRRHARLGFFIASGMTGMALGQWIFSTVYTATNKHAEWMLVPIYAFLVVALFAFRPPPRQHAATDSWRDLGAELRQVGHRLLPLWLLQVFSGASLVTLHFLLPELAEERGCPPAWVNGGAFFVLMAGTAILTTPVGHLADRFGRRRVSTACLMVGAMLYFVVVLGEGFSLWQFGVLLFLYGGIHASAAPILIAHAQHVVAERRSVATGVMMGWAWAASVPATWLVGSLVSDAGLSHAHAMAWLGIPGVVAALLAVAYRKA